MLLLPGLKRPSKYSAVRSECLSLVAALLCSGALWLGLRGNDGGGVSSMTNNNHCLLLAKHFSDGQTKALCKKATADRYNRPAAFSYVLVKSYHFKTPQI